MTDFISLLAIYYACDEAATQMLLPKDEAMHCAKIYKTVKLQFLSSDDLHNYQTGDTAQKATIMQLAYLSFKEWETQNGPQVRDLRQSSADLLWQG